MTRKLQFREGAITPQPTPTSDRKVRAGGKLAEQLVRLVLDIRASGFDADETAELEAAAFQAFTPLLRKDPSPGPEITAAIFSYLIRNESCPLELAEQVAAAWTNLPVM